MSISVFWFDAGSHTDEQLLIHVGMVGYSDNFSTKFVKSTRNSAESWSAPSPNMWWTSMLAGSPSTALSYKSAMKNEPRSADV